MIDWFDTTYWFMFPIAICVASVAMSTVVGGAMFFSAVFIFILDLPIKLALATAITTQMFGFMSGLYFHSKRGHIDYGFGGRYLLFCIPSAILGVFLVKFINIQMLKVGVSILVMVAGYNLWKSKKFMDVSTHKTRIERQYYNHGPSQLVAALSSVLFGLTSIGLGEVFGYYMLNKMRVPARVAVSTTVFMIVVTTFVVSSGYIVHLILENGTALAQLFNILKFTIPAVICGAYFGTHIVFHFKPYRLIQFTSFVLCVGGVIFFITSLAAVLW